MATSLRVTPPPGPPGTVTRTSASVISAYPDQGRVSGRFRRPYTGCMVLRRSGAVALATSLFCLGCSRSAPEPPAPAERAPVAAASGSAERPAALQAGGGALSAAFRFPAAPRVVAVGDLHGDFKATQQVLRLA